MSLVLQQPKRVGSNAIGVVGLALHRLGLGIRAGGLGLQQHALKEELVDLSTGSKLQPAHKLARPLDRLALAVACPTNMVAALKGR